MEFDKELWQYYYSLLSAIKVCQNTLEVIFELDGEEADEMFFRGTEVLSKMYVAKYRTEEQLGFYEPSYYSLN